MSQELMIIPNLIVDHFPLEMASVDNYDPRRKNQSIV